MYQEAITWCQKGLAVSFDQCRKSQFCFGDFFHLITHVKERKVGGSHILLTLINIRIQETGRLVMYIRRPTTPEIILNITGFKRLPE